MDSRITVDHAVLPPGAQLRGHSHALAHICVVTSGGFVENGPHKQRTTCYADTIRVSPPETEHQIDNLNTSSSCTLISFDPELYGPFGVIFEESIFQSSARLTSLSTTLSERATHDPLGAESDILEILAGTARWTRTGRRSDPPRWLHRVRDHIESDFALQLGLASLAQEAGVHRSHLARAFSDHFGLTIGAYLRNRRLAHARYMLMSSEHSLSQVALESGFFDQAHMTREFSRIFAQTPGRMRQNLKQF